MIGILLITHGGLGQALLDTAQMIVGQQENVRAVGLDPDSNLEQLRDRLDEAAARLDAGQGVLALVDLFGGTPANAMAALLRAHHYVCLCGVNLPMLLEALLQRDEMSLSELAAHVEKVAHQSVVNLNTALEQALHDNMHNTGEQ